MTPTRTYLGFDYGDRKIGIAVGQDLTGTAQDLDTVGATGGPDWNAIARHVEEWQPSALVVGLPLDSAGGETEMSRRARKFGRKLAGRYNLPVHWVNEYLTSSAARYDPAPIRGGSVPRKRDQIAARIILESFLSESHP